MPDSLSWLNSYLGGGGGRPQDDDTSLQYLNDVLSGQQRYSFDRPYFVQPTTAQAQEPPAAPVAAEPRTRLEIDPAPVSTDPMLSYRYQRPPPQQPPPQTYQTAPDTIPFNTDMTPVPDTGRGTYWDNATRWLREAPADVGNLAAGLAERLNLGTANMLGLRAPGAPFHTGEVPVEPGLSKIGDVGTFLTGGLTHTLYPAPGALRAGAQYAGAASRDVLPMLDAVLADEAGVLRMTPRQRKLQELTLERPLPEVERLPEEAPLAAALGHNEPPIGLQPGQIESPFTVPAEDIAGRQRRALARDEPHQLGMPGALGSANNPAIELPNGVHVGDLSPEQFFARAEKILGQEGANKAARWYEEAYPTYEKYFGKEKALPMMTAWLMANQNATPGFAQLSATRALEQYINQTQGNKMAGLAHDKLARLWDAVQTGDQAGLEGILGSGLKISDFVDSAMQSPTRSMYGHDPRFGAPAVIDVMSFRGMGRIDPIMQNWIRKTFGDEVANKINPDMDMATGAGEVPYQWSANKLRRITDIANQNRWLGRDDWTPSQMQAVDWMTISKMMGRAGQTAEVAIRENVRNLSYELAFGNGAPFNEKFGDFHGLPYADRASITESHMNDVADFAHQITGAQLSERIAGSGGWMDPAVNPSMRASYVGSPEVMADTADIIGYLGQQTAVYQNRWENSGKNWGLTIMGPQMGDTATVSQMWQKLRQQHPDLVVGFSPVIHNGVPGMEFTFNGGGKKLFSRIEKELIPSINSEVDRLGIDTTTDTFKATTTEHSHDWTKDASGGEYIQRLSARYGPQIRQKLDDYQRTVLEPKLGRAIAAAKARQGQAAPAAAGPGGPLAAPPAAGPAPPLTGLLGDLGGSR